MSLRVCVCECQVYWDNTHLQLQKAPITRHRGEALSSNMDVTITHGSQQPAAANCDTHTHVNTYEWGDACVGGNCLTQWDVPKVLKAE